MQIRHMISSGAASSARHAPTATQDDGFNYVIGQMAAQATASSVPSPTKPAAEAVPPVKQRGSRPARSEVLHDPKVDLRAKAQANSDDSDIELRDQAGPFNIMAGSGVPTLQFVNSNAGQGQPDAAADSLPPPKTGHPQHGESKELTKFLVDQGLQGSVLTSGHQNTVAVNISRASGFGLTAANTESEGQTSVPSIGAQTQPSRDSGHAVYPVEQSDFVVSAERSDLQISGTQKAGLPLQAEIGTSAPVSQIITSRDAPSVLADISISTQETTHSSAREDFTLFTPLRHQIAPFLSANENQSGQTGAVHPLPIKGTDTTNHPDGHDLRIAATGHGHLVKIANENPPDQMGRQNRSTTIPQIASELDLIRSDKGPALPANVVPARIEPTTEGKPVLQVALETAEQARNHEAEAADSTINGPALREPETIGSLAMQLGTSPAPAPIFLKAAQIAPQQSQTPAHRQVVHAIQAAFQQEKSGQIDLVLQPQELGRLRFEMTPVGEKIHVMLFAERPEAMDLLRRHADQLLADLRQSGFGNATMGFGNWAKRNQSTPDDATRPSAESEHDSSPGLLVANFSPGTRTLSAQGRLDLRL